MLDSLTVPAWVAQVIRELKDAAFVELTGIVASGEIPGRQHSGDQPGSSLFGRYEAWDRDRNDSELDPLLPVDLSDELAGFPFVKWAALSVDVILWLSSRSPGALPAPLVRFGVWSYQTSRPDCFWELYHRNPVTSSSLAVLNESGSAGGMIAEQFAATEMGWSASRNRTVSYWKASALILKSLGQLYRGDSSAMVKSSGNVTLPPKSLIQTTPSNTQMVQFFVRNAARTMYRRLRYGSQDAYWFIAYRTNREKFVSQVEIFHPGGFTAVPAPEGHFYADPFVFEHQGRNVVFFEDYPYLEGKGVISAFEMDPSGQIGETRRVLERPYHLSYPLVFAHEGSVYMIPETYDAHQIELYRASHFPDQWELTAVLRENVNAVDTTLWVENGIFYFFTNIAGKGVTPNDLLYLFCADSLTGEWNPHPDNPINTDVRSSRGAGKLFRRNGKLIRPAQDCSVRYGYACQLNEVKILSPDRYLEAPLSRIEPAWSPGLIGTHTINSNQSIEVIDGQIYRKKFSRSDSS